MKDINSELEKIEVYREDLEDDISRAKMLTNLYSNSDFNELIVKDLFVKEAARCVSMLHSDACRQNQSLADKMNMKIVMIGELQNWFMNIGTAAAQAKEALDEADKFAEEGIE